MTRPAASRKAEVAKLPRKEKQLRKALKMLVGLLEEYAPRWYTEEHRDKAREALAP